MKSDIKLCIFYQAEAQASTAEAARVAQLRANGWRVRPVNSQFFDGGLEPGEPSAVCGSVPKAIRTLVENEASGLEILPFDEGEAGTTVAPKLTKPELIAALKDMGVEVPPGLKVDELRELHAQKAQELL